MAGRTIASTRSAADSDWREDMESARGEGKNAADSSISGAWRSSAWDYDAAVDDVSAFVLAGGQSTRMGEDKAFLLLDGRTLLQHALELARSVADDARIVDSAGGAGSGTSQKFAAYAPVIQDIYAASGPLAGIHAALRATSTELNLMLAVDVPLVT